MFEKIKKEEKKEFDKNFEDHIIKDIRELKELHLKEQEILNGLYKRVQEGYVELHETKQNDRVVERFVKSPNGNTIFYENVAAIYDIFSQTEKMKREKDD